MAGFMEVPMQAAAAGTGNGNNADVRGFGALAIQVTGTFVGTVTFEGTVDGSTWVAMQFIPIGGGAGVTSVTAPGIVRAECAGYRLVRARVSAYTSGTITATGLMSTM